ncbi:hypothetical protein AYK24_05175 [Thermoplasmatales archaeon SG8-52-4]|nr:MAG: hypothetical protein AYK24_05175 [Thermoplasmatales archaeon SG8-52-4]
MKNINRKILITMIVMIGIFMSSANVMAESTATVEIEPEEPTRMSTVTFTVNITSDEDIQAIHLITHECRQGLCYADAEVTLTKSGDDYTGQYTYTHDDSIYIEYWVNIDTDQETGKQITEVIRTYLDIESNNGGTNGGSDDDNTPGFELFTILIAIVIGAILVKRKRSR